MVKPGAVAQPVRAALPGRATSPGMFEVQAVLGKTENLAPLADQAGQSAAWRRSAIWRLREPLPVRLLAIW